jgi:hypothetical protein
MRAGGFGGGFHGGGFGGFHGVVDTLVSSEHLLSEKMENCRLGGMNMSHLLGDNKNQMFRSGCL